MSDETTWRGADGLRMNWWRAEFVLALCGVLGFVPLLFSVKTVWGGLPAHPLFIHVPVVLIPVTVVATLVCVVRPQTLKVHGILVCAVAIIAMASTFLAIQAGGALRAALHLRGETARLISEHSQAANILAIGFVLLTGSLILSFASYRIRNGSPTGVGFVDRMLGSEAVATALRVLLVVLALFCAFFVFRVGDLGAKAVWAGKLQAAAYSS